MRKRGGVRTARLALAVAAALLVGLAGVLAVPAISVAAPVADFTFAPTSPSVGEAVTFTFTGSCDAPPCRIRWRWFQDGGSSLGTAMGEGPEIAYAFATAGSYEVVVRIANSTSTHGSAMTTHVVTVADAPPPPPPPPPLTASFTSTPEAPVVGEEVSFTFTGSCDVPPCRIEWRWFQDGGSSLGTSMGEGPEIAYAFGAAGSYQVVVRIANSTSTNGSAMTTHVVTVAGAPPPPPPDAQLLVQDRDPGVVLDGWRGRALAIASHGGFRTGKGRVDLRFAGRRVAYGAVTGPDLGYAEVVLDHGPPERVDLYSPVPARHSWVFRTGPGRHVLTVRAARHRAAASTGRRVSLDGFVVGAGQDAVHLDDRSPRIRFGRWAGRRIDSASGGTVRVATRPGARVAVSFRGTSITWVTAAGPDQGRARVRVDGTVVATVDNRTAAPGARLERTFSGLEPGTHHATIEVLRDRRSPAGAQVTVDAFLVDAGPGA